MLNDFKLEEFLNRFEFKATHLLCGSDCQSMSINELLALEPGSSEAFSNLWLGYTQVEGSPALRQEISRLYQSVDMEHILVHAGAEEAIYNFMHVALRPGDHVICQFPAYQSLYEVASSLGCTVSRWRLSAGPGGWTMDLDELTDMIQTNTRLIVIATPHNPTGYMFSKDQLDALASLAQEKGIVVFADQVYKGLEHDSQEMPWVADLLPSGISLGVMSKSYGLAGLRIGWVACQDDKMIDAMRRYKHYTSICCSAPSEFLAAVALRRANGILARNRQLIRDNLRLAADFFQRFEPLFENYAPLAGPIGFHQLKTGQSILAFCEDLVLKTGVLLLPGTVYDMPGSYFRMGYGRKNFASCLEKFGEYLSNQYRL